MSWTAIESAPRTRVGRPVRSPLCGPHHVAVRLITNDPATSDLVVPVPSSSVVALIMRKTRRDSCAQHRDYLGRFADLRYAQHLTSPALTPGTSVRQVQVTRRLLTWASDMPRCGVEHAEPAG